MINGLDSPSTLPPAIRGTVTLSIDLEDWHQLVTRRFTGRWPAASRHVDEQSDRLLELLNAMNIRATFFVVGSLAQSRPGLVRRIAVLGHEVGSHGMLHLLLRGLDRLQIRAELEDSRKLLSDVSGQDVVGFRAPEFSIVQQTDGFSRKSPVRGTATIRVFSRFGTDVTGSQGSRALRSDYPFPTESSGSCLSERSPRLTATYPLAAAGTFVSCPGACLRRRFVLARASKSTSCSTFTPTNSRRRPFARVRK